MSCVIRQKEWLGNYGMSIRAFDRDLRPEVLLDTTIADKEGSFEIVYSGSCHKKLFYSRFPDFFLKDYCECTIIKSGSKKFFLMELQQRFLFARKEDIDELEFTNELSDLTGNHLPLAEMLQKEGQGCCVRSVGVPARYSDCIDRYHA